MKKATTIILSLVMVAFAANLALAGNGHGNNGGNNGGNRNSNWNSGSSRWNGGSSNWNSGSSRWNGGSSNWNHNNSNKQNWHGNNSNKQQWYYNNHKNYGNYSYRYQYVKPYVYYPYYYQTVPQRPIVVNTPVNIVTPPAPAVKVAKAEVKPETKVEMGDTVRITSERIVDTGDGRATMKIGHATRKLEVVDWSKGYVIVKIPTLKYKTEKVVSIMVFNGPGRLANRIDAVMVPSSQYDIESQNATSQQ